MRNFEDNIVENAKRYDSGRQFIQDVQKMVTSFKSV